MFSELTSSWPRIITWMYADKSPVGNGLLHEIVVTLSRFNEVVSVSALFGVDKKKLGFFFFFFFPSEHHIPTQGC